MTLTVVGDRSWQTGDTMNPRLLKRQFVYRSEFKYFEGLVERFFMDDLLELGTRATGYAERAPYYTPLEAEA